MKHNAPSTTTAVAIGSRGWRLRFCRLSLSLSIGLAVMASAEAKQAANVLNQSRSPDGLKERVVVDANPGVDGGGASGTVSIREIKTGRSLCSFDWFGFSVHPDAATFQAILWRPDSKAVAVASEITRGYVECKLYLLAKGNCREVKLPDYVARVQKKCGVEFSDKGHELPVKWLEKDRLVIRVGNRASEKEFQVTLKLVAQPHSNRATARIEAINLMDERARIE